MNIILDAECGCGFALERTDERRRVTLRSQDLTLTREYQAAAHRALWQVADFIVSVPAAAQEDRQEGTPGVNLVDTSFDAAELGLLTTLEVVGPEQSTVRANFVLEAGEGDGTGPDRLHVRFDVDLDALLAVTSVVDLY